MIVIPPGLRLPFPLVYGCHSTEACGLHYSNCLKLSQLQNALPQPLQKHSTPAVRPFATPCKPITSTHTPRRPFTHGRHCRARMGFIDGTRMSSSLGAPATPHPTLPAPPQRRCREFLAQVYYLLGAGVFSQGVPAPLEPLSAHIAAQVPTRKSHLRHRTPSPAPSLDAFYPGKVTTSMQLSESRSN